MGGDLFYLRQKYRIPSTRLKNWNYSSTGYYFITICTYKKNCYFGEIKNNQIILSKIGKIAKKYWLEIPKHYKNVILDEFIIMPNHIHGIIVIENKTHVETCHGMSLQNNLNKFSKPISGSISVIINQYKSAVKRYCNNNSIPFHWQSCFYDHIIRNEHSLNEIRHYIKNNPLKWEEDEENPKNKKYV